MNTTTAQRTIETSEALPAVLGEKRFTEHKPTFKAKEEDTDMPGIVSASDVDFSKPQRASIYAKYDGIEVGQAVIGLQRIQASTLVTRLTKKGMKLSTHKMANGLYGVVRLADDAEA